MIDTRLLPWRIDLSDTTHNLCDSQEIVDRHRNQCTNKRPHEKSRCRRDNLDIVLRQMRTDRQDKARRRFQWGRLRDRNRIACN